MAHPKINEIPMAARKYAAAKIITIGKSLFNAQHG